MDTSSPSNQARVHAQHRLEEHRKLHRSDMIPDNRQMTIDATFSTPTNFLAQLLPDGQTLNNQGLVCVCVAAWLSVCAPHKRTRFHLFPIGVESHSFDRPHPRAHLHHGELQHHELPSHQTSSRPTRRRFQLVAMEWIVRNVKGPLPILYPN